MEDHAPVLLITGAGSGIGAATARRASAAGHRVVLAGRTPEPLRELARELGGPGAALAVPCDVSDWGALEALVDATLAAFGQLDAVFANAAVETPNGWQTAPVEDWRTMVLTNVLGTALTVRATLDAVRDRGGHYVLTSSRAARLPIAGSLYGCTKSAVQAMGESLRLELDGTGVRVTVVAPGWTETPIWGDRTPPAGVLRPADVAEAVLYAIAQPSHVDVNEILLRPTVQPV